jgi:hypothetical protein
LWQVGRPVRRGDRARPQRSPAAREIIKQSFKGMLAELIHR